MARWWSGLTHMPFTHAFMGSNPVRVTKNVVKIQFSEFFYKIYKKLLHYFSKYVIIKEQWRNKRIFSSVG